MNKKLTIDGDAANKQFNLRTTDPLCDALLAESGEKNISINLLLNQILHQRYTSARYQKYHPSFKKLTLNNKQ